MLDAAMRRNLRFVATMSVGVRRHLGLDEETIRREALAVASKAVSENIDDQWKQESFQAAMEREIDLAIEKSR